MMDRDGQMTYCTVFSLGFDVVGAFIVHEVKEVQHGSQFINQDTLILVNFHNWDNHKLELDVWKYYGFS